MGQEGIATLFSLLLRLRAAKWCSPAYLSLYEIKRCLLLRCRCKAKPAWAGQLFHSTPAMLCPGRRDNSRLAVFAVLHGAKRNESTVRLFGIAMLKHYLAISKSRCSSSRLLESMPDSQGNTARREHAAGMHLHGTVVVYHAWYCCCVACGFESS